MDHLWVGVPALATGLLAACASINPHQVADGSGAQLRNTRQQVGKASMVCSFTSCKTADGGWRHFFPGGEAKLDTRYRVPAGEVRLGVEVLYFPGGGPAGSVGDALMTSVGVLFSDEARRRFSDFVDHYEILAVNHVNLDAGELGGLRVDARDGEVYRARCRIDGGRAWIWVEDQSGRRVSQVAPGFAYRDRRYWLWDTLPDP